MRSSVCHQNSTCQTMDLLKKFMLSLVAYLFVLAMSGSEVCAGDNGAGYAMYVWKTGFDNNVAGCNLTEFLNWDTKGQCFTHTWDTAAKRQWLWDTCNVLGREIFAIFLNGLHHILRDAYDTKDCNSLGVQMVRETIDQGHTQVYVGCIIVNGSPNERLDGVATNNEAYAGIKCADDVERIDYLNNLKNIVTEAGKQRLGKLLTHYSVGWHWGRCSRGNDMITWNGKTQTASRHMIDIFDSVDVQILEVDGHDVQLKYLKHKNGNVYTWPVKDDMSWVSIGDILMKLSPPELAPGRGLGLSFKPCELTKCLNEMNTK